MAQASDPKAVAAEATATKLNQSETSEATLPATDAKAAKASKRALDKLISTHAPEAKSEQETEERTAPEAQPALDADYHKAMAALKRDGFPDPEAFAKAQPEAFVDFGLKRAKVQSDVDSHTGELTTAKQKLAELQKQSKEAPATDDGAQPASAEQRSKIAAIAEPLVKTFDDVLGEDVGEPLRKAFTDLAEQIVSNVQQQMSTLLDSKLSAISDQAEQVALRQARKNLTEKWPKLVEEDRYQAVRKHLKRLGDDAELPDAEARLDYCCGIEFAPDLVKEANKVLGDRNKWRDNGAPSTDAHKASPRGAMSHQELSRASLKARITGDSDKAEQLDKEMNTRRLAATA